MNRRVLIAGVAVLLVVVGVATTFVLPLNVDSTDEPFELGESESYVSSGEISAENYGLVIAHDATVLGEDDAHLTFEYENRTVEHFYDEGRVYTKYEGQVDDEEWISSTEPTDAEEVHFGEYQNTFVRITKENGTVDSSDMWFVRTETEHLLTVPEFDRVDEQDNRLVYAPSSTWTEMNSGTMRISPESGELEIDQETGVLRDVSLQYRMTEASSYGEYLLWPGETETVTVQYEYDPAPTIDEIETPAWVAECVENDRCEF